MEFPKKIPLISLVALRSDHGGATPAGPIPDPDWTKTGLDKPPLVV
jgi:hypothetical protein